MKIVVVAIIAFAYALPVWAQSEVCDDYRKALVERNSLYELLERRRANGEASANAEELQTYSELIVEAKLRVGATGAAVLDAAKTSEAAAAVDALFDLGQRAQEAYRATLVWVGATGPMGLEHVLVKVEGLQRGVEQALEAAARHICDEHEIDP